MVSQGIGTVEGTCDKYRRCIQGSNHYVVNLKLYHTVFTNRNSIKLKNNNGSIEETCAHKR